jgi:hypothetical protein
LVKRERAKIQSDMKPYVKLCEVSVHPGEDGAGVVLDGAGSVGHGGLDEHYTMHISRRKQANRKAHGDEKEAKKETKAP